MQLPMIFATLSSFVSAYSQSDFFGKLIFIGLYVVSAICWIVLVYKTLEARRVKKAAYAFQKVVEKHQDRLLSLELSEMPRPTRSDVPHPFGQIFSSLKQKTLDLLNKNRYFSKQEGKESQVYLSKTDLELLETHVLTTISTESKRLDKNLFILSTVVTLAPFLGLLGTVWGILVTFSELHKGASASSNSAILGGLSTALVTTVIGLVIAIPALIFYNYLRNSLKTFSSEMEDFLYRLLSTIEIQYRKTDREDA